MRTFCVCVPARNEADRIGILIAALGEQTVAGPVSVALCVNNSDDATSQAAIVAASEAAGRVDLQMLECVFDPPLAHAGSARRAAMALGADIIGEQGLLISTDADCRPPRDWVEANLAASGSGRIVGGRIEIDVRESVPAPLLALRRRFDRYWQQVRAIEDAIDPVPWDPAPRHGDHTGASLAMSVSLYRQAGGVPLLATGEDRALVEAAIAVGGQLVHPPTVWTRASARAIGRADGGMAADMALWTRLIESGESPSVPDYAHWRDRAEGRRRLRDRIAAGSRPVAERHPDPIPCDMALPEL